MPDCATCKQDFGIERGKSVYCYDCPNYTEPQGEIPNEDEVNKELDLATNYKGGEEEMGELTNWAKETSPFIRLQDGESLEAVYNGYKIIPSRLDPDKETVQYKLGEKYFESSSGALAKQFDEIKEGTKIKITRQGTGNKTKYILEKL